MVLGTASQHVLLYTSIAILRNFYDISPGFAKSQNQSNQTFLLSVNGQNIAIITSKKFHLL